MSYKNGDIFRWSFTNKKIEQRGGYSSTTYWCMSKIAIYKDGLFKDTYWNSGAESKTFTEDQIVSSPEYIASEFHEVSFIANFDDLDECRKTEFSYYADSDCVNISHANNTSSGFYIRKGADKSLEKMRKIIVAHIDHYEREQSSAKWKVERLENDLETLTIETYIPCGSDVYI